MGTGRPIYWAGYGKLATRTGTYPLYVLFYPSSHFSRLHLDGLNPSGGLQGTGALCTSPGVVEALKLSGTVYGRWSSTNDAMDGVPVLTRPRCRPEAGLLHLDGRWEGAVLTMDDRDQARAFSAPA